MPHPNGLYIHKFGHVYSPVYDHKSQAKKRVAKATLSSYLLSVLFKTSNKLRYCIDFSIGHASRNVTHHFTRVVLTLAVTEIT